VLFLSSSRRAGEIVRKSTPASALISPTYVGDQLEPLRRKGICTNVTEWCAHNDGLVAVLLVVIEDVLDRFDTRVVITFIILAGRLLVPVQDLVKGWVT
jgi:hypothetical protein